MGLFSQMFLFWKSKVNSALDAVEDPAQLVEYAYEQQHALLRKTKQGLIDVATAKARLEGQSRSLRSQIPRVDQQAADALRLDREDLARVALQRKQTILAELEQLDLQVADVARDEERLTQTERQLSARIEDFRVRRDSISARYTAAKAQVRVTEAMTGISGEFAELSMALGRAVEKTERMQARAEAIGSLMDSGSLALPGPGGDSIERELRQVSIDQAVEADLADLRARLGPTHTPQAIEGQSREAPDDRNEGEEQE